MWSEISLVFIIMIVLAYAVQISSYVWAKPDDSYLNKADNEPYLFLSVVVPFRNEKDNLLLLLADLQSQDYPENLFEVIFVDDHSNDDSVKMLTDAIEEYSNYFLLELDEYSGKKYAIHSGVNLAKGNWIIQADADCRLPIGFVSEHARGAQQSDVNLLAGPVTYAKSGKVWDKIETLEFLSLVGTGMRSFFKGKPVMCNGANLSYSKNFYKDESEGLLAIDSPSGDDMFLLQAAKRKGVKMDYLFSKNAIVISQPSGSFKNFLRQRIRWGSKSTRYTDKDMIFLTLIVFLANISLMALFSLAFFFPSLWILFVGLCLLKFIPDFLLVGKTVRFFDQEYLLRLFPLTALFYYFYLVLAAILSLLSGYQWKGRRVAR